MRLLIFALLLGLFAACATTGDATDPTAEPPPPSGDRPYSLGATPQLRRDADAFRTIQLYRTGDETSLPVLTLGTGETLTLRFDRFESRGEPLSVYFYHFDRQWKRRLLPSEYLAGFLSDDLLDYEPSGAPLSRYVHYDYAFPNGNLRITRSGNYVLRVTRQGDEEAVLFERPFLVVEQGAEVDLAIRNDLPGASLGQPVVRLRPSPALQAQVFDYTVCFARNGRLAQVRCASEPTLLEATLFQFFLPREASFPAEGPLYELDFGLLRGSPQVARLDLTTVPYRALLNPDYARFGSTVSTDVLTSQPVVAAAVRDVGDPDVQAEYVDVQFQFVPEGDRPAAGPVLLSGAFNNWMLDPEMEMTWNPDLRRYEHTLLLKQGRYLYRYAVSDPAEEEQRLRATSLDQLNLYTALVYLKDYRAGTDRLVGLRNVLGR